MSVAVTSSIYWPALQTSQLLVVVERNWPAKHAEQSVTSVAAAESVVVPGCTSKHDRHVNCSIASVYLPITQVSHTPHTRCQFDETVATILEKCHQHLVVKAWDQSNLQ